MKEDFLHYIWRLQKYDSAKLTTSEGKKLDIVHPGRHNHNAGPDFLEGQIKIDDTTWAGNIEIHVKSSDWFAHKHENDLAYDNVVLHVVYEHDKEITRRDKTIIPTLILKPLIDLGFYNRYKSLIYKNDWIPCAPKIASVSEFVKNTWKDALVVERLEYKIEEIRRDLLIATMDWESTFFMYLAMHLGTRINKEAFRLLCNSFSRNILLKHKNNIHEIEALLFGQAGLLDQSFSDGYPTKLKTKYLHLKHKYSLDSINYSTWKFMRLRPANFPSIRIAQLSQLIFTSEHLFSKCMAAKNIKEFENTFDIEISQYWKTHYIFDKASNQSRNKRLGKSTIYNMVINTIVPFLFLYGREKGIPSYEEKAIKLLEEVPPENNNIIKKWNNLGYHSTHAFDTQALIQLKNTYCDMGKCLECRIGHTIMSSA